jgi:nucleotide-binding universal stress UspA family protein
MWDIKPRRILVAVEDSECDAAMEYAVREAKLRRCGVHLIHVVPLVVGRGNGLDPLVVINGQLHYQGRKILGDAATKFEHLLSDEDLSVSTELCHGHVVATLVEESAHASLVVVQHRGMGPAGHTPVLSVTTGVAARSHVPVVAVPASWQPPGADVPPIVTVGVDDDGETARLIRVAAEQAERLGARLRVLHAGEDLELPDVLDGFPELPVEFVVSPGEPDEVLLDRAADTSLFVLGRRHPRLPLGQHLGPVVRTVLRRSPVPVMVVDPGSHDFPEFSHDLATAVIP